MSYNTTQTSDVYFVSLRINPTFYNKITFNLNFVNLIDKLP